MRFRWSVLRMIWGSRLLPNGPPSVKSRSATLQTRLRGVWQPSLGMRPSATALIGVSEDDLRVEKSKAHPPDQERQGGKPDDEREENAAKYRKKVDELNRSRDIEIERALTLRAGR
jgi:hypothetical protein